MASTYVNNLRLEEIGSGEQSGTWGDTTNTNLELIGQATAWGTRAIANASTDNITIADGAADADRCLGLKLTGGGQACTVTLLPNTSSKTWIMYNATSYDLTFTCGSGANVIIPAGNTKVIATDGLGSGGVVHDLLTSLNVATNLYVKNAGTGDGSTANIYLQTAEADIAANDVIGKINFQAPNEGTGTDAILVAAAIQAKSEGDFSSTSNATSLNFMTGASEAATTKMTLSSAGDLTVTGDVNVGDDFDVTGNAVIDGTALVTGVLTTTAATVFNGGFTANDGSTITTADNSVQLTLKSTDADASGGPILDLTRDSANPADGDVLGLIRFKGDDAGGNETTYAQIIGFIQDEAGGAEDGTLKIETLIAGSSQARLDFTLSETVFNEGSLDLDFRVESNGSTNALLVDGGNNHVNIMTSTDFGGVLNVSGNVYIQNGDNNATLTLECTDADANVGPKLDLFRNSANPADNDYGGIVRFLYEDDADNQFVGSQILTQLIDASDGSEDVKIVWETTTAGASTERFTIGPTETVMNEQSIDVDFRVESNSNVNMLFVDGGNDTVAVGTSTAFNSAAFTSTGGVNGVHAVFSGQAGRGLLLETESTTSNDDTVVYNAQLSTGEHSFETNSTERMRISSAGSLGIGIADGDVTSDGTAARTYVGIIGTANRGRLNIGSTASNGADGGAISFLNGTNELGALYNDASAGSQTTGTMFFTANGKIDIRASDEVVFNQASADVDFRVETDGNANALFINGGTNTAAFGTSTTAGVSSNVFPVVAGGFTTQSGQTSGGDSGSTVTLMTFSSNEGNFLVSALGSGTGNTGDNTTGIIHLNNAASTYTNLVAGGRLVLSMDGLALKCVQSIFNDANINWNVIRISR